MSYKTIIILSIFLITTLWGCNQTDTSLTSTTSNEVISSVYNETDTTILNEDKPLYPIEVIYLPLIIDSLLDIEIKGVYISQSTSSSWGENLTNTLLSNNTSIELELPIIDTNSLTWDFLFVDVNGNEIVIPEVDFSNATLTSINIILKCNDVGEIFYSFL